MDIQRKRKQLSAYRRIKNRRRRRQIIKYRIPIGALILVILCGMIFTVIEVRQAHTAQAQVVRADSVEATEATEATIVTADADIPKQEVLEEKSQDLDADEAYLLAKMAMAEAEGEDIIGKALIIRVILNRVKSESFPDTVEAVIAEKNAFTSYRNGRFDRVEPNSDCFAALALIQSEGWDGSEGALYFERSTKKETWHSQNLKKLFQHGNHIFYTEKE